MTPQFEPAQLEDAEALLSLQRSAYASEAALYPGMVIPPIADDLAEMRAAIARGVVYKLVEQRALLGSVRAELKNRHWEIGPLVVWPELQRRGLGRRLMAEAEALAPAGLTIKLFTGRLSENNLTFYRQLGYRESGRQTLTPQLNLIWLSKVV
ncbi:MAG: GNAT family N-acetyltransferase [bacterium]|nr:GNAT family N-acetyltransferase [bacterium]